MSDLPRFTFDREANAGYVRLREGRVAKTVGCCHFMAVDYDTDGGVIGVEFLTLNPTPDLMDGKQREFWRELWASVLNDIRSLDEEGGAP